MPALHTCPLCHSDEHLSPAWCPRAAHVAVTGWNADGEPVEEDGFGATEAAATVDAIARGGIVEVGDASVVREESVVVDPAAWRRVANEGRRYA
jgi:hypothetical protein